MGAIISLDDLTHIEALLATTGSLPETLCFRYNPLKAGNTIIGHPEEAKYGLTRDQLFTAYARARDLGVKTFGLHTMVVSNELDEQYHTETARMLFELVVEMHQRLGIRISFINTGGGIGIPYRPEQKAVDYDVIARGARKLYDEIVVRAGLDPLAYNAEEGPPKGNLPFLCRPGRFDGQPDAPGMYGAYHHITISAKRMPRQDLRCRRFVVRKLRQVRHRARTAEIAMGDLLVIHDTGAMAMPWATTTTARSLRRTLRAPTVR